MKPLMEIPSVTKSSCGNNLSVMSFHRPCSSVAMETLRLCLGCPAAHFFHTPGASEDTRLHMSLS